MAPSRAAPEIAQLVALHHQALYRYAYRLTGSVPDAEDLTQQAFLLAHERLSQLRDPACAQSWLFSILQRCYLKSRRQRLPLPAAALELELGEIAAEAPAESIDSERLQQAIDALDDEFKLVILMFYFEYCSYRQIADRLEIPLGTVMSRLARAKAHIRQRLCELAEREQTAGMPAPKVVRAAGTRHPVVGRTASESVG